MNPKRLRFRAAEEHAAEPPVGAATGLALTKRSADRKQSRHSRKFRLATIGLVVVGAVAIVAAIVLSASGTTRTASSSDWSAFQPQDDGLRGAQEIADFVAPYYRASAAYQLAVVTAMNLSDPSNPLEVVIPAPGAPNGLQALPPDSTVAYNLCGLGSKDCSIGVGTPSSQRLLLLRREALELALYTFKYISGTQTVVAVLPPGHTQQSSHLSAKPPTGSSASSNDTKAVTLAVAFDRKELQPWLDRPLRETLPEPIPPTVEEMANAPEAELVSVISAHGLFQERTEQAQDGSKVLVLTPQSPQ
jgi:hypothetical protein